MELRLFRQTTIGQIKKDFTKHYPYLKLDFFTACHKASQGSPLPCKIADSVTLGKTKTVRSEGLLFMPASMKVAELENLLQTNFGLSAQVFRKIDGISLQTIQTDHLTLEKQNKMGEISSRPRRLNLNTLFL